MSSSRLVFVGPHRPGPGDSGKRSAGWPVFTSTASSACSAARPKFADLFKGFNFFIPSLVAFTLVSMLFTGAASLLCVIPGLVVAADVQIHVSVHCGQTHGFLARDAGQPATWCAMTISASPCF